MANQMLAAQRYSQQLIDICRAGTNCLVTAKGRYSGTVACCVWITAHTLVGSLEHAGMKHEAPLRGGSQLRRQLDKRRESDTFSGHTITWRRTFQLRLTRTAPRFASSLQRCLSAGDPVESLRTPPRLPAGPGSVIPRSMVAIGCTELGDR